MTNDSPSSLDSESITRAIERLSAHQNTFKHFKIVKRFGGRSLEVVLMQDPKTRERVIRKTYKSSDRRSFKHETRVLMYLSLRGWRYSPSLLHVDSKRLIVYMSYCGKSPPETSHYRSKARARLKQLQEHHHMSKRHVSLSKLHNFCVKDDEVYVIDFGNASRWVLKRK